MGKGSGSTKRRKTFVVSRATALSYSLVAKLAAQAILPAENTAPPSGPSKNTTSERTSEPRSGTPVATNSSLVLNMSSPRPSEDAITMACEGEPSFAS